MSINSGSKAPERRAVQARPDQFSWGELGPWAGRMQDLMEQMWSPAMGASDFAPGGELRETDDAFTLELDVPGVDKKDIEIDFSGRRLSVRGTKTTEKEGQGTLRHTTRTSGSFTYEAVLPVAVDEKAVTASLADGVLMVTMPKATEAKTTHVEIS
ncbi:Hsp20/alpha crystallin family protein [Terrabacter carboxydivorans]|uniref:SHSP domain-containing protein n=1 Tax=Terrabacter carboxydivorans TaxID=619730 RepID=A0ABP5YL65_9MICO